MKLLILESNNDRRLMIADALISAGYEVALASSLPEASLIAQSTSFSVAMVGWDGSRDSVCEIAKGLCGTNSCLILMSENLSAEQVQLGLQYGADDFVFQPSNANELIIRAAVAERILGLRSLPTESVQAVTAPKFSSRKSRAKSGSALVLEGR